MKSMFEERREKRGGGGGGSKRVGQGQADGERDERKVQVSR